MHIPKTGGETLRSILRDYCSSATVYLRDWPQEEDIERIRNLPYMKFYPYADALLTKLLNNCQPDFLDDGMRFKELTNYCNA